MAALLRHATNSASWTPIAAALTCTSTCAAPATNGPVPNPSAQRRSAHTFEQHSAPLRSSGSERAVSAELLGKNVLPPWVSPVRDMGCGVEIRPRMGSGGWRYFDSLTLVEEQASTVSSSGSSSSKEERDKDNKVSLGKTLRTLQERLPTLLQSPLPQDILAPNISLHLFPSTHPHLPVVSGRVAYNAALWTSPIAWNRIPIVGNLKLEILSERMTKDPLPFAPRREGAIPEQLVVRWCTRKKGTAGPTADGDVVTGVRTTAVRSEGEGKVEFTGLFIFQFNGEGRILSHTIEHAQESGSWERGVGAKVVGLTDWLLGGIKGRQGSDEPCPAFHGSKKDLA